MTRTTTSGLSNKLRDDTEEYFRSSFSNVVVNTTLWYDSKFHSLPGHHPHANPPRIRRLDSIGMSRGRRSIQPYAVIDPGAVEELIGGDGWYISFISTQTETLSGALEGMGTFTLPKVDAITAIENSEGTVILLGVGNATHDSRSTQHESLLNSHHLRSNGVDVQDITTTQIKLGGIKHRIPLDFDGDIMTIKLRTPTDEELETLGVAWITPAMHNYSPQSIRRSRTARPSYELEGVGPVALPQAEISTSTTQTHMQNNSNTCTGNKVKNCYLKRWGRQRSSALNPSK